MYAATPRAQLHMIHVQHRTPAVPGGAFEAPFALYQVKSGSRRQPSQGRLSSTLDNTASSRSREASCGSVDDSHADADLSPSFHGHKSQPNLVYHREVLSVDSGICLFHTPRRSESLHRCSNNSSPKQRSSQGYSEVTVYGFARRPVPSRESSTAPLFSPDSTARLDQQQQQEEQLKRSEESSSVEEAVESDAPYADPADARNANTCDVPRATDDDDDNAETTSAPPTCVLSPTEGTSEAKDAPSSASSSPPRTHHDMADDVSVSMMQDATEAAVHEGTVEADDAVTHTESLMIAVSEFSVTLVSSDTDADEEERE